MGLGENLCVPFVSASFRFFAGGPPVLLSWAGEPLGALSSWLDSGGVFALDSPFAAVILAYVNENGNV